MPIKKKRAAEMTQLVKGLLLKFTDLSSISRSHAKAIHWVWWYIVVVSVLVR